MAFDKPFEDAEDPTDVQLKNRAGSFDARALRDQSSDRIGSQLSSPLKTDGEPREPQQLQTEADPPTRPHGGKGWLF